MTPAQLRHYGQTRCDACDVEYPRLKNLVCACCGICSTCLESTPMYQYVEDLNTTPLDTAPAPEGG